VFIPVKLYQSEKKLRKKVQIQNLDHSNSLSANTLHALLDFMMTTLTYPFINDGEFI